MAAKMATILGDVTDLQQRHHPLNIPHFFEKINGFPLKAKSFRNTATYQKTLGRGTINPHPLPTSSCLYHSGGVTLRVRPRVKKKTHNKKKHKHTHKLNNTYAHHKSKANEQQWFPQY